jgi:hypothetical protein
MTYATPTTDEFPSGRGISFSGAIASVLAAFVIATGAAAWVADSDLVASVFDPTPSKAAYSLLFDARFQTGSAPDSFSADPQAQQFSAPNLDGKVQEAKVRLAQELRAQVRQTGLIGSGDGPAPSFVAAVPRPGPRPVETNLALRDSPFTASPDNRTLLQKLSDLLPARVTLASLSPDGELLSDGPDLTSLGYDNLTAVYDISARTVYMPNGLKLEAHSGFGRLMDDPAHVGERDVGATPPNVYDSKPRERLFSGVQAFRMILVGDNGTLGRSGLLGTNGDSNGCVSIKNYDKFLKAFSNGEIKRRVVVDRSRWRRLS